MKILLKRFGLVLVPAGVGALLFLLTQTPTAVLIVHTNDIHGQLLPRGGVGGGAEAATIIRGLKPDMILDAGDLSTGSMISDMFQGRSVIDVLNSIGYSAVAVGNHEFDFGMDSLRDRVRLAKFPFLSANTTSPVSEINPFAVLTAKGIRFGVIGLTTEEVKTTSYPKHVRDLNVIDLVRALEKTLPEVRRQSDFVVLVTHITESEEEKVANAFPDVQLIIGGHSHSELPEPRFVGKTMIVRTGNQLRFVGRLDLTFSHKALTRMTDRLIPVKSVQPDPQIRALLSPYEKEVAEEMRQVVAEATADLMRSRREESPLSNLIADSFRKKAAVDVGLQNMGGIRADIRQGPITRGAIFEVLPFQNTVVTLKMTGAQLKATLAWDLMAIGGLRAEFDTTKPAGQRLVSISLADGSPVRDDRLYTVATNDFVVAGGDGFAEFGKAQEVVDTGQLLRDVFSEYVAELKTVRPARDGRVKMMR